MDEMKDSCSFQEKITECERFVLLSGNFVRININSVFLRVGMGVPRGSVLGPMLFLLLLLLLGSC